MLAAPVAPRREQEHRSPRQTWPSASQRLASVVGVKMQSMLEQHENLAIFCLCLMGMIAYHGALVQSGLSAPFKNDEVVTYSPVSKQVTRRIESERRYESRHRYLELSAG